MKSESASRTYPLGLYCGSLYGQIRNWLGVQGISYLHADDEELYVEMIDAVGAMSLRVLEEVLKYGKGLRGIGGMDKKVFAGSREDVDREIERLRHLVPWEVLFPARITGYRRMGSGKPYVITHRG